jgi:hypothetical protein
LPLLGAWQKSKDEGIFGIRDRLAEGRPLTHEQELTLAVMAANCTNDEQREIIERAIHG